MINEWYDDGEENAQIRRSLWMNICHAIHINGNVVYSCTHSQPSGCPITAILNSIYNLIIIRIAYLICAEDNFKETGVDLRSLYYFNLFVAMVAYGDDNLIAICDTIISWFNQISITKALAQVGHEYTDEAKTGLIVPIRDLSEVAYLKRSFVFNGLVNRYVAPLNLQVVLEMVMWTKQGLGSRIITMANLDVTMRELSLHTPEIFDRYSNILRKKCLELGYDYRFYTQLEYLGAVTEEPLLFHDTHLKLRQKPLTLEANKSHNIKRKLVDNKEIEYQFLENVPNDTFRFLDNKILIINPTHNNPRIFKKIKNLLG